MEPVAIVIGSDVNGRANGRRIFASAYIPFGYEEKQDGTVVMVFPREPYRLSLSGCCVKPSDF